MNKRKKWGIITLVICIIGGIVMFSLNHQKEKTLEEKMRIEQDRMALYLVSHYEKVEKIEFTSFQQNKLIERDNPEVINSDSLMSNITVIYWVR